MVKLVRAGHERAFEAIVHRYRGPLVRYCGRLLPESRREDAVQQAFINAHAGLLASDEPVQLKAWLFTITRNAALNMARQSGWNHESIPLDFDGVRRPDQVFEQRIALEQTVAAVNDLPARQRDALVMREFEGRSYDEIALALGANDGAVRQLLNRARVTLRNAASALIPPPLVARAAASLPAGDGRRAAEILGGLGAAGVAKAGATALVAGSLVVGAMEAPLPINQGHEATREKATLTPAKRSRTAAAVSSRTVPVAAIRVRTAVPAPGHREPTSLRSHKGGRGSAPSGPSQSGRSGDDSSGRSGSDDGRRSGSGGSGDSRAGSSSPTPEPERSGSGTSGSGDRTSSSGSGGGTTEARETESGSGSATGSSGGELSSSGPSGSSESGSSGSGPSGTSTPSTTTSGPGSSGSGSGGSSGDIDH